MKSGKDQGRVFARKSIAVRGPQRWKVIEDLVGESHIMAKLPHSHVCSVLFTYEFANKGRIQSFGIVMGTVADMNLAEYMEEEERGMKDAGAGGRLPILNECRKKLLRWSGCLIRALSFIHSQRVRHRDIKPANILIKDSNILISDFGISKQFEDDMTTMTITDPIRRGTPRYWAPEVASEWPNRLPRTRLSDVWSMGCVLLEMATLMDDGFVTEYRERPEKYFETPDDILQRIASNRWSAKAGGLDTVCFLMLNPFAEYRLRSNELALVVKTLQVHMCENHDCQAPEGIATEQLDAAMIDLIRISRQGHYKWDHINKSIERTNGLQSFLLSTDTERSIRPVLLDSQSTTLSSENSESPESPYFSDNESTATEVTLAEEIAPKLRTNTPAQRPQKLMTKRAPWDVVKHMSSVFASWYSNPTYFRPVFLGLGASIVLVLANRRYAAKVLSTYFQPRMIFMPLGPVPAKT